jgi:hypothetical protein
MRFTNVSLIERVTLLSRFTENVRNANTRFFHFTVELHTKNALHHPGTHIGSALRESSVRESAVKIKTGQNPPSSANNFMLKTLDVHNKKKKLTAIDTIY